MDRRTGVIIVVVIAAILIGMGITAFLAWRTSNEILAEFHSMNNSLDSTLRTLDERRSPELAVLGSLACREMALQADSLREASRALNSKIDTIKSVLTTYQRDDASAGDSLFNAGLGNTLYLDLLAFFDMAERSCMSDSVDLLIAKKASMVRSAMNEETWRERNFVGVPAIACRAILSKCQGDVASAELLTLNELLERCRTKVRAP